MTNPFSKKINVIVYIFILLNVVQSFSSPAQTIQNRYEISQKHYEYIISTLEHDPQFLSLPYSFDAGLDLPITFKKQHQSLSFDAHFISAFEKQEKSIGFCALHATGQYRTPWLNARVRLLGYSTASSTADFFQEIAFERFVYDQSAPITGMFETNFIMLEAHLAFIYQNLQLGFGRDKLRWGPGYKGTLLHSGHTHVTLSLILQILSGCLLSTQQEILLL